ncbi:MAG: TrkA family potassium uptake protein [Clostridiales bacterium]|nr:TrkA family potassium uptake protein [Clostridiales bacterium]
MKSVLLIGAGQFGVYIARKFNSLGNEIMAVDSDEDKINHILPFVTSAQIGDASTSDFLETLGIPDFDICIVTIGDNFQDSLETTSLLKELGASKVISRASNDVHAKFLLKNGADAIVYPEKQVAEWAAMRFSSEHILDYMDLGDNCALYELDVPREWIGKTLAGLDVRRRYNINILAVKHNGVLNIAVSPDVMFQSDETILVLGTSKDIRKCFKI